MSLRIPSCPREGHVFGADCECGRWSQCRQIEARVTELRRLLPADSETPCLRERTRLVAAGQAWWTPYMLRDAMVLVWGQDAGGSDSGITAKLRDWRQAGHGGFRARMESRKATGITTANGSQAWEYRLPFDTIEGVVDPGGTPPPTEAKETETETTVDAEERVGFAGPRADPPPPNSSASAVLPALTRPAHMMDPKKEHRTDFKAALEAADEAAAARRKV